MHIMLIATASLFGYTLINKLFHDIFYKVCVYKSKKRKNNGSCN